VSDEEVMAAAARAMAVLAPAQLRLSDIAEEAGVTAGALVQRFGSKRELLLTMVRSWSGSMPEMFAALREAHESPLVALRAYVDWIARMGEGPGGVAHHLGWLQLDLADPDFHAYARQGAVAARRQLEALIRDAIGRKELKRTTDAAALARSVEVTVGGSLLAWAFHQEGPARQFLRDDLAALLAPHLAAAGERVLR
jgi:AcrR family transcriptional regulator